MPNIHLLKTKESRINLYHCDRKNAMMTKFKFQPNPSVLLIISTGIFLSFCLYVYKAYEIPTGVSESGHGFLFRVVSFGVLVSLSFALNEWLYYKVLPAKVKLWQWRIWEIFIAGSLVFLLYNIFWQWTNMTFSGYLKLLMECGGILIFPSLGVYFYGKYLQNTTPFSSPIAMLELKFISSNGKHTIRMRHEDFLFAKSEDNYVRIVYLRNNEVTFEMLRGTLTHFEKTFGNEVIKRCHRSYIINTSNILQVKSKNKKMLLQIKHIENPIPVSNKYLESFTHHI